MRIISGSHKGRLIRLPALYSARPTTDFAKTGLFNILANRIDFEESDVLDLFSGTGSISYEFASRGCRSVQLVENNQTNFNFICRTIEQIKFNNIKPIRADVFQYLKRCTYKFDVIFADPPYDMEGIESIPDLTFSKNLLRQNGYLIIEHSISIKFEEHPNFKEKREYGSVNFSFFQ